MKFTWKIHLSKSKHHHSIHVWIRESKEVLIVSVIFRLRNAWWEQHKGRVKKSFSYCIKIFNESLPKSKHHIMYLKKYFFLFS